MDDPKGKGLNAISLIIIAYNFLDVDLTRINFQGVIISNLSGAAFFGVIGGLWVFFFWRHYQRYEESIKPIVRDFIDRYESGYLNILTGLLEKDSNGRTKGYRHDQKIFLGNVRFLKLPSMKVWGRGLPQTKGFTLNTLEGFRRKWIKFTLGKPSYFNYYLGFYISGLMLISCVYVYGPRAICYISELF